MSIHNFPNFRFQDLFHLKSQAGDSFTEFRWKFSCDRVMDIQIDLLKKNTDDFQK